MRNLIDNLKGYRKVWVDIIPSDENFIIPKGRQVFGMQQVILKNDVMKDDVFEAQLHNKSFQNKIKMKKLYGDTILHKKDGKMRKFGNTHQILKFKEEGDSLKALLKIKEDSVLYDLTKYADPEFYVSFISDTMEIDMNKNKNFTLCTVVSVYSE